MRSLILGIATTAAMASPAYAHIALDSPTARVADLKEGPCGKAGSVRGSNITVLEPGATITVTWRETIGHPGHYRIAFDDDGDDDFPFPTSTSTADGRIILADQIADRDGETTYTQQVTLPNITCENCTLQVIQVMSTAPTYSEGDLYFQCADLALRTGGGGPSDGGGNPGSPDGGTGPGPDPDGATATGGCNAGGAAGILAGLPVVFLLRRRRR